MRFMGDAACVLVFSVTEHDGIASPTPTPNMSFSCENAEIVLRNPEKVMAMPPSRTAGVYADCGVLTLYKTHVAVSVVMLIKTR